jgi:hypothetical protein
MYRRQRFVLVVILIGKEPDRLLMLDLNIVGLSLQRRDIHRMCNKGLARLDWTL